MSDAPPPLTEAIPVGWRAQLDPRPRLRRLRESANAILQIVVAATVAYSFAHEVLGHPAPLIAATVTVSSLGLVRDARPRRVLQTVLGMLVGILVAELIAMVAGSGWWQLSLALALTMTVARLLSSHAGFTIAAAIQAIIVIVVPAEAPFLRLIDGVVGGVAALAVTALIPRNPHKAERRDAAALFAATGKTMDTLVQALRRGDRLRAERGLQRARALQRHVDRWSDSLDSGLSIARISPFLRRARSELQRHEGVKQAMDLATRNLRVVARRAVYQTDDRRPRVVVAEVLAEIARVVALVEDSLDDIALEPAAREAGKAVAARLDPRAILPDGDLGEHNLIVAMRPLVTDLLAATGMTPDDARACLPRL
ncbi:FUSC family protein [Microbacterium aquimaris]|uniref:FUSC family protein n=1 Tax=Microbacterium aquimaris TaxID=459816 RepID=A0ABU5N9V7_9MICO|nr:FUSC family protein [Microbacterium aquimaris]MDZ8162869.1 FUSC family protein [Microbacterium aquimaris]